MKRACVIGWPIEHSRSPAIHGHWLRQYGIDGSYEKVAVRPEDISEFLANLGRNGYAGCNVTIPHKEAAFAAAAVRDASAMAISAANTLWLENGVLHAANTDTYGYMTYLARRFPEWQRDEKPVAVLGAGGAARAIVFGFLERGVSEVRLLNRSRDRAEAVSADFDPRVKVCDWTDRSRAARDCAVLVNTTSVGLKGEGDLAIDFAGFDPACIVSDIVYVPLETALIKGAKAHGLKTLDGLGMLLHQAVPGFEKWFGIRPDVTDDLFEKIAATIGAT